MQKIKESVLQWMDKMYINDGMYKMCKHSDKDILLDSTSLGYDLEYMLGKKMSEEDKDKRKTIMDSFQSSEEGFFYEKNIDDLFKNSKIERVKEMHGNYLTFQVIGAYKSINRFPKYKISFYDKYIDNINKYLDNNCPWERSPWGAGGMVDNLGTILKCNIDMGYIEYKEVVDKIFSWLDANQDSKTGLWKKRDNSQGINGLINGGYHLMRGTYFTYKKSFNYPERIIDTIIEDLKENEIFQSTKAHGCNDLDHFYLLDRCNSVVPQYRYDEICDLVLKRKNVILKLLYCDDGGFSFHNCSSVMKHNYVDVSQGVKESDMQGTVFYLQTLCSINNILKIPNIIKESKTHG